MVSIFTRKVRPCRQTRRSVGRRLGFEALESRVLLAGDVTAVLSKGNLVITGDDYNNTVALTVNGSNLDITGNSTTINDSTSSLSIPLVQITGSVKIQMADGNDQVTIYGLTSAKKLTVNQGDGDNVTTLVGCTFSGGTSFTAGAGDDVWTFSACTFTGACTINSGEGDNTVQTPLLALTGNLQISARNGRDNINLTDAVVTGNVAIANGDGGSIFYLNSSAASARITGNLTLKAGEGSDSIHLAGARIDGRINADFGHGSGDHGLFVDNSTFGGNIAVKSLDGMGIYDIDSSNVGGNIAISSQIESGYVYLDEGTTVGGNVSLNCKQSPYELQIRGATIQGNVSVRNGAGSSSVSIDSSQAPTHLLGSLTVRTLSGNKDVTLEDVTIDGNVTFDLAGGEHSIDITDGTQLGGNLTIKALGRETEVTLNEITVAGTTLISTGSGHDTVTIDDCTFSGRFRLNTGAGNDVLNIERSGSTSGPITVFNMAATIDLGTGNDQANLGDSNSGRKVRFTVLSTLNGGKGIDSLILNLDGGVTPTQLGFES